MPSGSYKAIIEVDKMAKLKRLVALMQAKATINMVIAILNKTSILEYQSVIIFFTLLIAKVQEHFVLLQFEKLKKP
jgi:hypothetical protein